MTMTFINLPVRDLAQTTEFFTSLGFAFDQNFTDANTTCMVISDTSFAMLHLEPTFQSFTNQDITDTSTSREVLIGLSAEDRGEVDDKVDRAIRAGGQAVGEPQDYGFMYMRAFRDLDGHQWSYNYMDMEAAMQQA